jgi:hypothetical protein
VQKPSSGRASDGAFAVREARYDDCRVRTGGGSRSTALAGLVVLAIVGSCGSSTGASTAGCPHPCDLAQSVRVEVSGGTPANVAVTDPCGGSGACVEGGCAEIDVFLRNSNAVPAGDGGSDLVCHLTVTSTTGQTAEADLTAQYTAATCCSGYEFPWRTLALSFGADGSAGAGADPP